MTKTKVPVSTLDRIHIPTILGLGLLLVTIFLGMTIYFYQQTLNQKINAYSTPKKLELINLTDSSASLVWLTEGEVSGQVRWGENSLNQSQFDDRDGATPANRSIHIVTLKNLTPKTTYKYQIISNNLAATTGEIKTPIHLDSVDTNTPVIGKVLSPSLEPSQETLVTLSSDDSSKVGTVSSLGGNFIISLNNWRSRDLNQSISIQPGSLATLTLTQGGLTSQAKIKLAEGTQVLPPIILGQNTDLTSIASSSSQINSKFDLNKDGKVNAVDLSIVILNLGKKGANPADLDSDGVVDQKDVDLLIQQVR